MIRALRIINWLLVGMVAIGALAQAKSSGIAEGVGGALWSLPFFFALRAAADKEARRVRPALIANSIGLVVMVAILLFVIKQDRVIPPMAQVFMVGIICSPFLFNIIALSRWKNSLSNIREAARVGPAVRAEESFPLFTDEEERARQAYGNAPQTAARSASEAHAVITDTSEADADPSKRKANYFVRHWRGELSLPVSYWINGSLLGLALVVLITMTALTMQETSSLRANAFVSLLLITTTIVFSVWSLIGTWRSAEQHESRGGSAGWATAAKVMIVLGMVGTLNTFVQTLWPQMQDHAMLAFSDDRMGRIKATVSADGAAIELRGAFGAGSAEDVRKLLAQVPGAGTLILDSTGGRLLEASRIAEIARERQLNTYVEGQCASACTYVFLAGRDRAATPNAQIGFHRPSFPGLDGAELNAATEDMLKVYRQAGVSEQFLGRVKATSSEDMWYPTRDELINAGIINRISFGGENQTFHSRSELELAFKTDPLMKAIDVRFPGSVAEAVEGAWQARASGLNDAAVLTAARAILIKHYYQLLLSASDEKVSDYLTIALDQMLAAQVISDEACTLLANAQLNVARVLPRDLVNREMQWLKQALSEPPQPVETLNSEKALEKVLVVLAKLDPAEIDAFAEPEKSRGDPRLFCRANVSLLQAVDELPLRDRAATFRALQQLAHSPESAVD